MAGGGLAGLSREELLELVRRQRAELAPCEAAVEVLVEEGFDRGGAMVGCAILDQEERLGRLFQDGGQEGDVARAVETAVDALGEQPPAEQVDQAEHLVRLALASGLDDRLLPD